MTTECYFGTCPHHSGEGPHCDEPQCRASEEDLERYQLERRLIARGYDLDELEMDNPYRGSSI